MNELIVKDVVKIENLIYEIRGKQVMLDSDLAKLYECTNGTKDINKAVKRNIERFPDDFCFKITEEESLKCLRFQFGTLNKSGNRRGQHLKYLPYAFTQEGVAMLASCLRSNIAKRVSVDIMRAFVMMRRYISNDLIEQKYINKLVLDHEERLKIVESTFANFKEKNNHLFFKGQVYDAYSLLIDIFNKSKEEIIIIDNYIDKNILDILLKTEKKIKIVTNKYNNEDYNKYKKQYNNVNLVISNDHHDRFIIIDKKTLYHCGSSFKDLGKKCFAINLIEDKDVLNNLLKKL